MVTFEFLQSIIFDSGQNTIYLTYIRLMRGKAFETSQLNRNIYMKIQS